MLNSELLRYQDFSYVLWDLETENLNLCYARPWQASWLIVENKKITEEHNYYIWWDDLNISKKAAEVTRFNYNLYKSQARDAREILNLLEKSLLNPKYKCVGHNHIGFDSMIHQVWRQNLGLRPDFSYINRCIDTLAMGRAYRFEHQYKRDKPFLAFQYEMMNIRKRNSQCGLGKLAKELDVQLDENRLHDASYDSHINKAVFEALLKKIDI